MGLTSKLSSLFLVRLDVRVDAFVLGLFAAGLGVHEAVRHDLGVQDQSEVSKGIEVAMRRVIRTQQLLIEVYGSYDRCSKVLRNFIAYDVMLP